MKIAGRCPACGRDTLAVDGDLDSRLQCIASDCEDPDAAHTLLMTPDAHCHVVEFASDGMVVEHPLMERAAGFTSPCALADQFGSLTGPPGTGRFRIPPGGSLADLEPIDDAVLFEKTEHPHLDRGGLFDALPIGLITPVPTEAEIPDGWVEPVGQTIPIADHEALIQALRDAGKDFGNPVEDPTVIRLPDLTGQAEEGYRLIMRVR